MMRSASLCLLQRCHVKPMLLAVVALVALAGCLGPREIPPTLRYTLDPAIEVPAAEGTEYTLGMRPLAVAQPYGLVMAFRDAKHRLGYRDNEEWAEDPGDVLSRAILDALVATGRFRDTGHATAMARPDLLLTGELRAFHENRRSEPPTAEIEVRLELREARGTAAVWGDTLRARLPLADDSGDAFAEAMEHAVAEIAAQSATAIAGAPLSAGL